MELQILPTDLLVQYTLLASSYGVSEAFNNLTEAELSTSTFSFYTSVASVYSSKIEGEDIELDSYIKHKRFGVDFQSDYTRKIDDLYTAYLFAQENKLNGDNIAVAHKLLAKHIVTEPWQGKVRKQNMYVTTKDGRIEYVAAEPALVEEEIQKLYTDIEILLVQKMEIEEVLFFAAMIHLVFVKIHPWNDGNGRSARLLEKWFIAQKLGYKAWFIQSEKYYYQNHQDYYKNVRKLGLEYPLLSYAEAMPFFLMLAQSVVETKEI